MDDDLRFLDDAPRIHATAQLKSNRLGRFSQIGRYVSLHDCTLGDFSYIEPYTQAIYADIGKFCSIASHVCINALDHPMERLTTHKISYRPNEFFRYQPLDSDFRQRRQQKRVVIGHDVWIGYGAIIMPGVIIGHGAVIGAGSVVTKDVGAYDIVAGNPAKRIRKRFEPAMIADLLAMQWWDWPREQLYDAIADMQTLSISDFINKYRG